MTAQAIIARIFGETNDDLTEDHYFNRFGFGASANTKEEDHNRLLDYANDSFNALLKHNDLCTISTAEQRSSYLKQDRKEEGYLPIDTEDELGTSAIPFPFRRTTIFPKENIAGIPVSSPATHSYNSLRIVWNREVRPPRIREAEPKILDFITKTFSISRSLLETITNPNDDHTTEIVVKIQGKAQPAAKAVALITSGKLKSELHRWIKEKLKRIK